MGVRFQINDGSLPRSKRADVLAVWIAGGLYLHTVSRLDHCMPNFITNSAIKIRRQPGNKNVIKLSFPSMPHENNHKKYIKRALCTNIKQTRPTMLLTIEFRPVKQYRKHVRRIYTFAVCLVRDFNSSTNEEAGRKGGLGSSKPWHAPSRWLKVKDNRLLDIATRSAALLNANLLGTEDDSKNAIRHSMNAWKTRIENEFQPSTFLLEKKYSNRNIKQAF